MQSFLIIQYFLFKSTSKTTYTSYNKGRTEQIEKIHQNLLQYQTPNAKNSNVAHAETWPAIAKIS